MARISNPKAFAGNKPLATKEDIKNALTGSLGEFSEYGYAPLGADGKVISTYLPKTGIDIKYNDGLVEAGVTEINFSGNYISLKKEADGVVSARVAENKNSSNFNTSDGVTDGTASYSGLTTTNMIMVDLTGSNAGIGDWAVGTTHKGFNKQSNSTINITTAGKIHFENDNTSFRVKVIKWDGTEVANVLYSNVVGGVGTGTGTGSASISLTVSDYGNETNAPVATGKEGKPTFAVKIGELLPDGGRFYVEIIHTNGTVEYSWKSEDLFSNAGVAPTAGNPSATLSGTPTTKTISGVTYYSGGNFAVSMGSIENLNKNATVSKKVTCSSGFLNGYSFAVGDLTGYTNAYDVSGVTWNKTLAIASNKFVNTAQTITCTAVNSFGGSGNKQTTLKVLVNSLSNDPANDLKETFFDESRRLTSAGTAWDSTQSLADNDGLLVSNKSLVYPTGAAYDYSTFIPSDNPNYSGLTGTRYFVRKFGVGASGTKYGAILTFAGSAITDASLNNSNLTLDFSKDGSTWVTMKVGSANGGCRVQASDYGWSKNKQLKIEFTLSDSESPDGFYVRFGLASAVTTLTSIVVAWA